MMYEDFVRLEDERQEKFRKIKVPYKPTTGLTITLLECRNISDSRFSDFFDTPDPKFRVSCPTLPAPNQFDTKSVDDVTSYVINETFKFVIPDTMEQSDNIPLHITVIDVDVVSDDVIAKAALNISHYPTNGKDEFLTINFGTHGELDIILNKTYRTTPDFRVGLELHPAEREFRKKRIPKVFDALRKVMGEDSPKNYLETPTISLTSSGGGFRASVGLSGAMEAFKDTGLLDSFVYTAGISGSAWYFLTAYHKFKMEPREVSGFIKNLKQRIMQKWLSTAFDVIFNGEVFDFVKDKETYGQPTSFVDFFGYLVGTSLLGENDRFRKMSDIQDYVGKADVPYPVVAMLHVKNNKLASKFHAYIECTPHEYSFPVYGYSIPDEYFGSVWNGGFLARQCPEMSLHFLQGTVGCAFSVIFNAAATGETSLEFNKYLDELRVKGKTKTNGNTSTSSRAKDTIESDDDSDSDDSDDSDNDTASMDSDHDPDTELDVPNGEEVNSKREASFLSLIAEKLKNTVLFNHRGVFLGRTAKYFNPVRGLADIKAHYLNPIGEPEYLGPDQEELTKRLRIKSRKAMSIRRKVISVVDAGVLCNVPTDVMLRPQRATDVLIVTDFSGSPSDDKMDYSQIMVAAVQAWQNGMKFPSINFQKMVNLPPKECIVLEDVNDDECPIVIWFTLCNKTFRNLKNFKPRNSTEPIPDGETFNDFNVFTKETAYSTFDFDYTALEFDRLNEMMYHTITSHLSTIKDVLKRATEKKRKRLAAV